MSKIGNSEWRDSYNVLERGRQRYCVKEISRRHSKSCSSVRYPASQIDIKKKRFTFAILSTWNCIDHDTAVVITVRIGPPGTGHV